MFNARGRNRNHNSHGSIFRGRQPRRATKANKKGIALTFVD